MLWAKNNIIVLTLFRNVRIILFVVELIITLSINCPVDVGKI